MNRFQLVSLCGPNCLPLYQILHRRGGTACLIRAAAILGVIVDRALRGINGRTCFILACNLQGKAAVIRRLDTGPVRICQRYQTQDRKLVFVKITTFINHSKLGGTCIQAQIFNILYLTAVFAAEHIVIEGNPG